MIVQVNGRPLDVAPDCTITQLVAVLGLTGKRLAVERNEEIVPRSRHADTHLCEQDRLEIVQAIGGG